MKKKNNYPKQINVRVSNETYKWYQDFGKLLGVKVNETVRKIPVLYDKMDTENDRLVTEQLEYIKEIHKLKDEINQLEKDSDKLLGDWIGK